jgi:hypothetical protein
MTPPIFLLNEYSDTMFNDSKHNLSISSYSKGNLSNNIY